MKVKYIALAAISTAAVFLFSAFGGSKVTLEQQLEKVSEEVNTKVAAFEASKRQECKAMAVQKAIGIAETQWAAESKGKKVMPLVAPKTTTKGGVKPTTKPATKPAAPTVKPATPTPVPDQVTTGRKTDPATNATNTQTTGRKIDASSNAEEVQTTGRRKSN